MLRTALGRRCADGEEASHLRRSRNRVIARGVLAEDQRLLLAIRARGECKVCYVASQGDDARPRRG